MSELLVEITRGEVVETIHRGDIVVVNNTGEILAYAGDPYKVTYMRSAAKPLQAMNVLMSGAADQFRLTKKEIAVICSSHFGERFHLEAVECILRKAGLQKENILGGIVTSVNYNYALQLARNNEELTPLHSDCSGKHAGMLSVCRHKGYPVETYLNCDHPCQEDILDIMSYMCMIDKSKITVGIDGCSVPVHAMPVYNMALAYARLANPDYLYEKYKNASKRIYNAMVINPEMISGTDGFCTKLIKGANGKLIGKVGAEGVYCVGLKGMNMGFAIKIESGIMPVLPPVVYKILKDMKLVGNEELENLKEFEIIPNLNDIKSKVGEIRAVFDMDWKITGDGKG